MSRRYSIAEARHNLAALVHQLEQQPVVELTRRGEPVAVLLSIEAYRQLRGGSTTFWEAYSAFRETFDPARLAITPEDFADLRDRSPGREIAL